MRATWWYLILVRRVRRYLGPVEATHKNSGNMYQNWIKLNSTGPSNRDRRFQCNAEVLGSIPILSERYEFLLHGCSLCYDCGSWTIKPWKIKLLRAFLPKGQYDGLIPSERKCNNNRVIRRRPVWELHDNIIWS